MNTSSPQLNFRTKSQTALQPNMRFIRNEAQLQLALQAMESDENLSLREAAKRYLVPHTTLRLRQKGIRARADTIANSRKLDLLEEEVIVRRVLDLYEQGFSPGYDIVRDIANLLLATRNGSPVGLRWALNFVRRQLELRTR